MKFTKGDVSDDADTDISSLKNAIYSSSLEAFAGSQVEVSVSMKNVGIENTSAYQFDIILPEGYSIALDASNEYDAWITGSRTNSTMHKLYCSYLKDSDSYRVVCSSSTNALFDSNDGEVLTFTLDVPSDAEAANYAIKYTNVVISDVSGKAYDVSDFKYTLTVNDFVQGDINQDSKVDVSDYVSLISHILDPSSSTETKAMDVNSDGKVNVGDVVTETSILLNK